MPPPSFRALLGIPASSASPSDPSTALIIIDAQNEYAHGKLKVTNAEASGKVIASLLEKFRKGRGKIVHVLHKTPNGAPIFTPGTQLAEEFGGLRKADGEDLIWKQHPGSFADTPLDTILKSSDIKKVVLVGYMAHVCISTTAREAVQRGYDVVLVEDAIGDRDIPALGGEETVLGEEVTRVVLAELADVFGTVVQSRDVV
ncbi:Isochorismatase hydrolase [Lindgomyces ingoldianus]|uniref:Isochorismatase hydrolase n=1 Tax=Lindgomyces ingoldianus TaxID=673940 RepID=A0ACB6QJF4_9PLEO|nr:Isochorismatase hydrolase [Lindgomyces ingoldianus]KAF2466265.1 Isochorismatase hydrolase [Lindgomyces ingoldianus]